MDTRRQPSDTTAGREHRFPAGRATPRRSPRHGLRLLVALCLLITGLADGAHGQTGEEPAPSPDEIPEARWAVQPSGPDGPGNRDWFIYTLEPGAVFGDVVAVSNLSDRPIDFVIYPSDVGAVADVGGLAPAREEIEPTDVGSWIELAASEYTVEPGTRIDVPFSITVPDDAEPGDHVGAIIAIDAAEAIVDPDEADDDVAFRVRQRIGARVYVRVEGPHNPALEVTQLSVSHDNPVLPTGTTATVAWEITNTGNLRLTPQATMKIKGFLGRSVKTVLLPEIPELLPGGNFVATSIVEDLPPLERFTVELEVTALEVETTRSKTFWPVPWLLLLLLLPIGWMLHRWYRRRKDRAPVVVEPPPPTPRKELAGV